MSGIYKPDGKLIIPDGFATGALPRDIPFGQVRGYRDGREWVADPLEDRMDIIPPDKWQDLIDEGIEVESEVQKIKSQGQNPSCTCEAGTQGVEILQSRQGLWLQELNPLSVFAFVGSSSGSSLNRVLAWLRDTGVLPEALWPREKGWRRKPPRDLVDREACKYRIDEFLDIGSTVEAGTCLLHGDPFMFAWQNHCCIGVRPIDRRRFKYANSWSPQWGDRGFGILEYSRINFKYGCFGLLTATDPGGA
jgi:hypothetical protein